MSMRPDPSECSEYFYDTYVTKVAHLGRAFAEFHVTVPLSVVQQVMQR